MSDWKTYKLKDLVTCSQGIQVPIDEQYVIQNKNMVRFIRIVDYTNPNEEPRFINKIKDRYIVKKNDVVMIRYGSATAGKVVRGIQGYIANNLFHVHILDENILDKEFLYFFLSQKQIYDYLMSAQSSTTMPAIKFSDLYNIEIKLPPINTQKEIAKVINNFENKITLNTQTNQTLEQIAQTIFKSWFIDFDPVRAKAEALADGKSEQEANLAAAEVIGGESAVEMARVFPSGFGEDGVPLRWEMKPLPELIDFLEGPGIRNWQYTENDDGIKFINIRCIKDGDLSLETANKITKEEAFGKYNHFQLKENDIVISSSGTLGRFAFVRNEHLPLCLNTSVLRFRPIENKSTLAFIAGFVSTQLQQELEMRASGSAQRNFGPMHLKQISLLVPNFELLELHQKYVSDLFEKRKNNLKENDQLIEMRDYLLPKLLSGEIEL
ncbi:restriction endonuclease subunit S [Lonepinella sp. BR2271]|uniref:restriction endonuclease subunit S n=1 Tax=Lonepinella sp. BR2271 TaxID=3434550 RepID=UPI003F6E3DAD